MSFIFTFVAFHLADVPPRHIVEMMLMFFLLLFGATICEVSSLSAIVAKHHGYIPVYLVFVSFYWGDVGHHVFILLSLILNHVG